MKSVDVIIPAAGVGKRFGLDIKKQFFSLGGKPIIYHTLKNLKNSYDFHTFIIGCKVIEDEEIVLSVCNDLGISNLKVVEGGVERFHTVYNCLREAENNYVMIHDSVRPFVKRELVLNLIEKIEFYDGVISALKVRDTLKKFRGDKIVETVNRDEILLSHTPQIFKKRVLWKALSEVIKNGDFITDEAQALEIAGKRVGYVESYPQNIKITFKEDLSLAENYLKKFEV